MSKTKKLPVSRLASDFEFVKQHNRAYIRSAVFLPLPRKNDEHPSVHPPKCIVTMKPEVILQIAHTLPAGHAMRMAHGNIQHATRERVDTDGRMADPHGDKALSHDEKDLLDQGRALLREITSELSGKHVYCIPNIHTIGFPSSLGHQSFQQLQDRVARTGSYVMRSCIQRLATLSEICGTRNLKSLKKSYFLRIIMEFLLECFLCCQTALQRAHGLLTEGESRHPQKGKSHSSEDPLVRVAASLPEVGMHLAEYLISEHKRHRRVELYFYGNSDIHALIATLESYQNGITTSNKAIREIIFQAVDFTNHPLFDPIYRYSGNRIPKLHEALSSLYAIGGKEAYLRFLNNIGVREYIDASDHHNPIWDTQALVCIMVACEWLAMHQKA